MGGIAHPDESSTSGMPGQAAFATGVELGSRRISGRVARMTIARACGQFGEVTLQYPVPRYGSFT